MENYKNKVDEIVKNGANNIKKKVIDFKCKPVFEKQDFYVVEGVPKYYGIDEYGRIIGAIALISPNTLPMITEKVLTYPRPYGWNSNMDKSNGIFESCHIIAYNLSSQTTDKENLFIGTNDLNRSLMKEIENDVKDYVDENGVKVLYKVTMKYRGTDQIPTGILIEAQSLDDEHSVCKFCYNIEKYVKFDYRDGTIIYNHNYLKKVMDKVTNKRKAKKETTESKQDYILNRETKECHYDKDCEKLKGIEDKYIQGTRTTEKVIKDNKFKFCDRCKKNSKE